MQKAARYLSAAFVASATVDFSRGFQATERHRLIGVALATLDPGGLTDSIVADTTTLVERVPWLESHG